MTSATVGLAFSAGMVATVNPCGFAMLPAYLSYFLGLEEPTPGRPSEFDGVRNSASGLRALRVSGAVTAGFLLVFGVMGFAWSSVSGLIGRRLPYFTIVVGVGLVAMGVAMLRGHEPMLRLPKVNMSSTTRELSSMFLYGISYAVASLSCTIPIFIGIVATTLQHTSFVAGLSAFVAYGLGMGATLAILTLAVALARSGIVRAFRKLLPHVNRISGGFLIVAGAFASYYGAIEISELNSGPSSQVVGAARDLQGSMQRWVERVGGGRLALAALTVVGAAVLIGLVRGQSSSQTGKPTAPPDPTDP